MLNVYDVPGPPRIDDTFDEGFEGLFLKSPIENPQKPTYDPDVKSPLEKPDITDFFRDEKDDPYVDERDFYFEDALDFIDDPYFNDNSAPSNNKNNDQPDKLSMDDFFGGGGFEVGSKGGALDGFFNEKTEYEPETLYGPALPPGLNDQPLYGPALPPGFDDYEEGALMGPALPPGWDDEPVMGPALPPNFV